MLGRDAANAWGRMPETASEPAGLVQDVKRSRFRVVSVAIVSERSDHLDRREVIALYCGWRSRILWLEWFASGSRFTR
jgi:hypothetical protein